MTGMGGEPAESNTARPSRAGEKPPTKVMKAMRAGSAMTYVTVEEKVGLRAKEVHEPASVNPPRPVQSSLGAEHYGAP